MKKSLMLMACAVVLGCAPAFGWGRLGHAAIAKIAEN